MSEPCSLFCGICVAICTAITACLNCIAACVKSSDNVSNVASKHYRYNHSVVTHRARDDTTYRNTAHRPTSRPSIVVENNAGEIFVSQEETAVVKNNRGIVHGPGNKFVQNNWPGARVDDSGPSHLT